MKFKMYSPKQIEELKQSEEKYHAMFEAMEQGVVYQNADGKITSANPAAEKILGLTLEQMKGKIFEELDIQAVFESGAPLSGKDYPAVKALKTGRTVKNIVIGIFDSRENRLHWTNANAVPQFKRLADKPYQVFTTFEDITERKKEKELSDTLNDINAEINSTLDLDEIMNRVVIQAVKAIDCESVMVLLRENNRWVVRYVYGVLQYLAGKSFTEAEVRATALASKTKTPVAVNDAYNDTRVNRKIVKKYKLRSFLVAPLIIRNKVIGTIAFFHHTEPVPFTEAEADFSNKLITSISLAIENVRFYEAERNIADTLQYALLTMPEQIERISFGYLYRSATEATMVGGDFYDLFEIEHGKVGIIIGDVSGKGLEAATLTSLVKNTIKAYAYQDESPASIVQKTDIVVKKSSPSEIFITVFFGILDTVSGKLVYCSAGHPPAILRTKEAAVSYLNVGSPIIGIIQSSRYIEGVVYLKSGDALILYTDGVIEARRGAKLFGEKRLTDLIKRLDVENAKEFPEAIFQKVLEFTDGILTDDVALLTISLTAR